MRRELVAKVLNMFEKLIRMFTSNYVVRLSYNVRTPFANLSPRNFDEYTT